VNAKLYSANGMQATSIRERKDILDPVEGESARQLRRRLAVCHGPTRRAVRQEQTLKHGHHDQDQGEDEMKGEGEVERPGPACQTLRLYCSCVVAAHLALR